MQTSRGWVDWSVSSGAWRSGGRAVVAGRVAGQRSSARGWIPRALIRGLAAGSLAAGGLASAGTPCDGVEGLAIVVESAEIVAGGSGEVLVYACGAEPVQAVSLLVQLADGGPGNGGVFDGASITSVDLTGPGTLLSGNTFGQVDEVFSPQAWASAALVRSGTVRAEGLLARVHVDVTTAAAGEQIPLRISGVQDSLFAGGEDSSFGPIPAELRDGVITVVADPCPIDFNLDGTQDIFDVIEFVLAFLEEDARTDVAAPAGVFDVFDVLRFLLLFSGAEDCGD